MERQATEASAEGEAPTPGRLGLAGGDPAGDFPGEMDMPFDLALAAVTAEPVRMRSLALRALALLSAPLLGALGDRAKRSIEEAIGDRRAFSAELATGLNIVLNFLLYAGVAVVLAVDTGVKLYTQADRGWIMTAILFAALEAAFRLRDGFKGLPVERMRMGAALYGAPFGPLLDAWARRHAKSQSRGVAAFEGYYSGGFDSKRERLRRYGLAYELKEFSRGYYLRMELPRVVPRSSAKEALGIPDEMPEYGLDLRVDGGSVRIDGSVTDAGLRPLCGLSSAFPPDFRTEIPLPAAVSGFRHRYADKLLEVVAFKRGDGTNI